MLRGLGVQPDEALRLVAYGMRHLSKAEIDELIATLDRRGGEHMAWWGPNPTTQLRALRIDGVTPLTLAASDSAVVELTAMGTDRNGFGFTVTTKSLRRPWFPVMGPATATVPTSSSCSCSFPTARSSTTVESSHATRSRLLLDLAWCGWVSGTSGRRSTIGAAPIST